MNQLTQQEWDALSAYLDNALKQRERQRLETQFQARPELRAAFDELRQTRQLLRQTPPLRAPHNFTLTPEMAGGRASRARTYPLFKLAFAMASLLFVLVIGGEIWLGNPAATPARDVAMAPQAETFMQEAPLEQQTELDMSQPENPSGERLMNETPVEEDGGGIVGLAPPPETTPTPEFTYSVAEGPTLTPEALTKNAPETETVMIEEEPLQEPLLDAAPLPEDAFENQTFPIEASPEPGWWAMLFGTFTPWRLLQIIFGGAVIVSGLGLFLLRRRN